MQLTLIRHAYLPTHTLGTLHFGQQALATIERPWKPNPAGPGGVPRESCVPDGPYRVIPHTSERFPNTYALVNEQLGVHYQQLPPGQSYGRTAILIHVGNRVRDVIGCIAVGLEHGTLAGEPAVLSSTIALNILRQALGRAEHSLIIRPVAGTQEIAA